MKVIKVETDPMIYGYLLKTHKDDLTVFASYTDPDAREYITEWGFKNSDTPLVRMESEGDDHRCFLFKVLNCDD